MPLNEKLCKHGTHTITSNCLCKKWTASTTTFQFVKPWLMGKRLGSGAISFLNLVLRKKPGLLKSEKPEKFMTYEIIRQK